MEQSLLWPGRWVISSIVLHRWTLVRNPPGFNSHAAQVIAYAFMTNCSMCGGLEVLRSFSLFLSLSFALSLSLSFFQLSVSLSASLFFEQSLSLSSCHRLFFSLMLSPSLNKTLISYSLQPSPFIYVPIFLSPSLSFTIVLNECLTLLFFLNLNNIFFISISTSDCFSSSPSPKL